MTHTSKWMAGALLPVLMLSACGGDDAPPAAIDGLPQNTISLVSMADVKSDVQKYRRKTEVSDAAGQAALEFLEEELEWADVSGSVGNYRFTDLEIEGAVISTAEVSGLRMMGDEFVYADYISIKDLNAEDGITLERMELSLPEMSLVKALIEAENAPKSRANSWDSPDYDPRNEELSRERQAGIYLMRNSSGAGYVQGFKMDVEGEVQMELQFAGMTKDGSTYSLLATNGKMHAEVAYDTPNSLSVDAISIKNYRLSDGPVRGGFMFPMSLPMGGYMNTLNPLNRNLDSISVRNISASYEESGMDAQIDSVDVWYEGAPGGGHYMVFNAPNIRYDFTEDPYTSNIDTEVLRALNMNPVIMSYGAKIKADPDKDIMDLEQGGFAIKDGGALNMTYKIEGFNRLISAFDSGMFMGLGSDENAMESAMANMVIRGFSMELDDDGLLERGLAYAASEQDMSLEEIRDVVKGGAAASTMAVSSEYQAELAQGYIAAFNKFIDEGGKFRVLAKPDESLSSAELAIPLMAMQPASPWGPPKPENTMEIVDAWLRNLNISFEHVAE